MLDELVQLYSYAEDLDTYEHAAKELSTFLAGPVSRQHFSSASRDRLTDRVGRNDRVVRATC